MRKVQQRLHVAQQKEDYMRRLKFVLCALIAGVVVSPAVAEITYTPVALDGFEIGIYNPVDSTINSVTVDPAYLSENFVFTFAIHVTPSYWPERLHFSFCYDNSSIEVVHAESIGFPFDNYSSMTEWPNTSHGIQAVASLSQYYTTGSATYWYSSVYPFFKVTLHVKSDTESQMNPFGITLPGYGPAEGYGLTLNSGWGYQLRPSSRRLGLLRRSDPRSA